jgi:hypothetical protein
MAASFEPGRHDQIDSSLFQRHSFFQRCCGTDCPNPSPTTFIQYLRGWNSVEEAEHRSTSVDDGMNLCLEVLRPDFYLRRWFNTQLGILSREFANLFFSDIRRNLRSLAI